MFGVARFRIILRSRRIFRVTHNESFLISRFVEEDLYSKKEKNSKKDFSKEILIILSYQRKGQGRDLTYQKQEKII